MAFMTLTDARSKREISVDISKIVFMQVLEDGSGTALTTICGMSKCVSESPAAIRHRWLSEGSEDIQPAATPPMPSTITVDDLRVGDEVEILNVRRRVVLIAGDGDFKIHPPIGVKQWIFEAEMPEYLSRGVQVYRDGVCISGWPADSPPRGGDAGRVKELESEIEGMHQSSAIDSETRFGLEIELTAHKDAYEKCKAELAAAKQNIAERVKALEQDLDAANIRKGNLRLELDGWIAAACLAFGPEEIPSLPVHLSDRIDKMKSELAAAKQTIAEWVEAAFPAGEFHAQERTPGGLKRKLDTLETNAEAQQQRITQLEFKIAALKSPPSEVPPLDPWRVLHTAHRFALDNAASGGPAYAGALWRYLAKLLWDTCEAAGKASSVPYKIK